jgi:hypothetical protein
MLYINSKCFTNKVDNFNYYGVHMLILALHANADIAFVDNRTTSVIKTRKKFAIGKANLGVGAVVQPEFAMRNQRYKGSPHEELADVDGINPQFSLSDTNLIFDADYEAENGWVIGYLVRFKPRTAGLEVDRNYVEASHKTWGTLQVGHQKGTHDLLAKLAQNVMPTIWIDGAPEYQVNEPGIAFNGADLVGQTHVAFKVNWMSPSCHGFKVAATYTPDTKNFSGKRGYFGLNTGDKEKGNQDIWEKDAPFGRHHFTGVALYNIVRNDLDVTLAGTVMYELKAYHPGDKKAEDKAALADNAVHNTFGFMASGSAKYKKFSAGVEYLNSGSSRLPISGHAIAATWGHYEKGHAGQAFNVAVAYEVAKNHKVGLGGQYTCRTFGENDADLNNMIKMLATLGYSWKFTECALWYTEAHLIEYKMTGRDGNEMGNDLGNNRGWAVMTGVRVEI